MDIPVEILDREIARAAGALSSTAAFDTDNPLDGEAHASRRAAYLDLVDKTEPLAIAARRWVVFLTLERVLWDDAVRVAEARRDLRIPLVEPAKLPLTLSADSLVHALLREADPARRRALEDALAKGGLHVRDAARIHAERRAEALRRLGPKAEAELAVAPAGAIASIAQRFLEATKDVAGARPSGARGASDIVVAALGRDATLGWPARLTVRWLSDLFHEGPLTEGLDLRVGALPPALGASSFARALGAFGGAVAVADGPSRVGGFFSLARSPLDLVVARRAALFASLAADPVFANRALDLGRGPARDQTRRVASALLVSLRLDAVRVLARRLLTASDHERDARFEEITGEALGVAFPKGLVGVLPKLDPGVDQRFAGALLAARDAHGLVQRFDEDWFRNPAAARALREEDAAPRVAGTTEEALSDGLAALLEAIGDRLG